LSWQGQVSASAEEAEILGEGQPVAEDEDGAERRDQPDRAEPEADVRGA
jgi:hypothetical protein